MCFLGKLCFTVKDRFWPNWIWLKVGQKSCLPLQTRVSLGSLFRAVYFKNIKEAKLISWLDLQPIQKWGVNAFQHRTFYFSLIFKTVWDYIHFSYHFYKYHKTKYTLISILYTSFIHISYYWTHVLQVTTSLWDKGGKEKTVSNA